MSTSGHENGTVASIEALQADIVTLKRDLAKALGKFKTNGAGHTRDARDGIVDFAGDLADDLTARANRAGQTITDQVAAQPVASLLIAFGVGYVVSRFLSR